MHHDEALGRLTDGSGRLDAMTAAELKRVPFKATADRMITLGELCDLAAGRATLVIELKSRFDGDRRLAARAAELLAGYRGPGGGDVVRSRPGRGLREIAPALPRGIVAERRYRHREWDALPAASKRAMAYFKHVLRTRPQFLAYSVKDLPAAIPLAARNLFGLPLLTWTVRSPEDRETAARWADQMIFEGFRP